MGRRAPEARAPTVLAKTPRPPASLCPEARKIFKSIVASKPPTWFDPGNVPLLVSLCVLHVQLNKAMALLESVKPEDVKNFAKATMTVSRLTNGVVLLSSKLRLTVQAAIDRRSVKAVEQASSRHPLLGGGNVTSFPRKP